MVQLKFTCDDEGHPRKSDYRSPTNADLLFRRVSRGTWECLHSIAFQDRNYGIPEETVIGQGATPGKAARDFRAKLIDAYENL